MAILKGKNRLPGAIIIILAVVILALLIYLTSIGSINNEAGRDVSVTVYSLPDSTFDKPLTEIPFYSNGNILFLSQSAFDSFDEGHQPWHSNPLMTVAACCPNLYLAGRNEEEAADYFNDAVEDENQMIFKDGTSIKEIFKNEELCEVELSVNHADTFTILLKNPQSSGYYFIQRISCTNCGWTGADI